MHSRLSLTVVPVVAVTNLPIRDMAFNLVEQMDDCA
jgi:hypothetical protein